MNFRKIFERFGLAETEPEFHQPEKFSEPLAIKYLRQIITADSRTSRTIMFNSKNRLENVRLEYKEFGAELASFVDVAEDFFGEQFIYSATIKNLRAANLYEFRIISGDSATDWQKLRTSGDGEFEMLVFSDSQCRNYDVWRRTASVADKIYPDAEICALNGDLVDNGEDSRQWRKWYEASENLRDRILVPVIGNHECYGASWLDCEPRGFLSNFKLPSNGVKDFGGYFYAFDYGAANFFVLNTQFMELEKFIGDLRARQEYWLRGAANAANRPWRIVFMHKSIFNRALSDFVDEAKNYFLPLFDELAIDLVLTGHLHTYRNAGKIFAQKKSERGTHYVLCGRSGDQNYNREVESFIALKIRAESLELTCRDVAGEIRDRFTLTK